METEKQITQVVSVEDLTDILKDHQYFRVRYFAKKHNDFIAVSYTHLTLPTICSV